MLLHVAMKEGSEYQKAHFFGYMIHRLLLAALDRREINDRDHFGERLDLVGPFLSNLFRMLFWKLTKNHYSRRVLISVILPLLSDFRP